MTSFKAKLRKIGNSIGVLIPRKVITNFNLGEEIEISVITEKEIKEEQVITNRKKMEWCQKHETWKSTCGCL